MPLAFESIGPNNPVVGDMTLGNVVQMDGIDWRVVHIDTDAGECVLAKEYWEENVKFDSGNSTTYNGSDIMAKCDAFLLSLSSETRKALVTKTVHGVEGKIWVPQINWISTSQPYGSPPAGSWTGTNVFRYFTDNNSRIYKDEGGTARLWWTASPRSSGYVYIVYTVGSLNNGYDYPNNSCGFRPFCCVPYVKPENPTYTLGQTVLFDNKTWTVCHVDAEAYTLARTVIESLTNFGGNVVYSGSTLATVASQYENNMSPESKGAMLSTTVNDVTGKVFVASYEQMHGGFSWFNSNERRICQYNGSNQVYWTSSPGSSSSLVWSVYADGSLHNDGPSASYGFRPFCRIPNTQKYRYNINCKYADGTPASNVELYSSPDETSPFAVTDSSGVYNVTGYTGDTLRVVFLDKNGYQYCDTTVTGDLSQVVTQKLTSNKYLIEDVTTEALTLGSTITMAGKEWLVCHVEGTTYTLALSTIYSMTTFGSSNVYAGSTLASVAENFENEQFTGVVNQKILDSLVVNTNVNGVTSKVFVPSYDQMNGGFSWFNSNQRRICQYNGSNQYYWTSSPGSSGYVWIVGTGGNLAAAAGPGGPGGFRPFVTCNFSWLPSYVDPGYKINGALTLGNTVTFDGKQWTVCHVESDRAYLALTTIQSLTKFGNNNNYSVSTLKTVAQSFESTMSKGAKSRMVNTTVNGVTSKIFVPSYDQMNGGFSWFNSNERRICKHNGSNQKYWTSSPLNSGDVWSVVADGSLSNFYPSHSFGFRPFCAVSLN